jgi:hypothetical protein
MRFKGYDGRYTRSLSRAFDHGCQDLPVADVQPIEIADRNYRATLAAKPRKPFLRRTRNYKVAARHAAAPVRTGKRNPS